MKQYISILCGLLLPLTIFSQHTISGQVVMPNAVAVCDVLVKLVGADGQVLDQEITQNDGLFSFGNQADGQDYTLQFAKEDNALNGVSTLDLVFIAKHILGVDPFNSPYQTWAADVNNSGSTTTLDMVLIRRMILGINQGFGQPAWKFIPSGATFPNGEITSITNLNADVDLDIVGVKLADVSGSATICE